MEDHSDSDTSLESEFGSKDELEENELEISETIYEEFNNALWNPQAQLQAQLNTTKLAQLHADIKAKTQLPDPAY